jgi:hypothetical protein
MVSMIALYRSMQRSCAAWAPISPNAPRTHPDSSARSADRCLARGIILSVRCVCRGLAPKQRGRERKQVGTERGVDRSAVEGRAVQRVNKIARGLGATTSGVPTLARAIRCLARSLLSREVPPWRLASCRRRSRCSAGRTHRSWQQGPNIPWWHERPRSSAECSVTGVFGFLDSARRALWTR